MTLGLPEYLLFTFLLQCFLQAYCLKKLIEIEKKQQEQIYVGLNSDLLIELVNRLLIAENRDIRPFVLEVNMSSPVKDEQTEVSKTQAQQSDRKQEEAVTNQEQQTTNRSEEKVMEAEPVKKQWNPIHDFSMGVRKMLPKSIFESEEQVITVNCSSEEVK